jgi:hypothetical protein
MDQLTVRRWVAEPPEHVWHRVLDLSTLVEDDLALDLEDLTGDHREGTVPGLGARATITRRAGARVERVTLHVEGRVEPALITLGVTAGGERWLVTVTITPLPGDDGCGSDVRLHAVRDDTVPHHLVPLGRRHRGSEVLGSLLDALAHQVTTPSARHRHAPPAEVAAVGQRMAAGR